MSFNPDEPPRRMGAHVYTVEALDVSDYGMPGFAFTGDLHIEPDDTPGVDDWFIDSASAPGGRPCTAFQVHIITRAVMADKRLCDFITEACYEHGED